MKLKKICALLCTCLILCGMGFSAQAAAYPFTEIAAHTLVDKVNAQELLKNGDFSTPESDTKPLGWGINPGTFGEGKTAEYIRGDASYVKLNYPGTGYAALSQALSVQDADGKKCQLSARVKGENTELDIRIRVAFTVLQNGAEVELADVLNVYFTDLSTNSWTQKIVEFTLPENIRRITLRFQLHSDLEAYVDDISLRMEGLAEDAIAEKPPVLEDYEMLENGDFSEASADGLTVAAWRPEPGKGGTFDGRGAVLVKDGGVQGNYAKVLSGETFPQLRQTVRGLMPTAEYRLIFKYKNPTADAVSFSCQMQYTKGGTDAELDGTKNMMAYYSDTWQDGFFDFECPEEVDGCLVSFRNLSAAGELCIDDVSLYMTRKPYRALVETDERFYYTEWKTGFVTVEDRGNGESLAGGKAVFTILDGDTAVLMPQEKTLTEEKTVFEFSTEKVFSEKGKEYTSEVKIYDADGEHVETQRHPVYRYDRPTYLGEDGVFRKPDRNGKMIEKNISIGNNVPFTLIDKAGDEISDLGITVVQMGTDTENRTLLERMDAVEAAGLHVLISLYNDKKSGGHPDMLENTVQTVNTVKNHPALFGYKVQDEPIQKMNTEDELATAYKLIRDLDPHHPIYLDDSGEGSYKRMARVCDIMDIDHYPSKGAYRASVIGEKIEAGVAAVKARKPVSLLQQGFEIGGEMPTANEFRHYAYQTLFSGGSAVGYHSFGGEPGHLAPALDEWDGLCEFAEWELTFLFDATVNRKYPMLNEEKTDTVWWRTYVKDGKIYAAILNRRVEATNTAIVSLSDFDGGHTAAGYTAKRIAGGTAETVEVTDSIFRKDLEGMAAYLYEITPNNTVDFSDLETTKYRDLTGYNWAYTAILAMEKAGVVNDNTAVSFAPGKNITRGDFAYFLIRALGLTSNASENFDDVPLDAPYAKEIAAGKKLGILNGVGENLFNPEGEITRQDLMAIAARGMRICLELDEGKEEDLAGYADAGLIAEYAKLDIAAMVRANIVKGNADGTVNPLGNTTRAEAAVIVSRIRDWQKDP
ncbi:MAG: S-layer homology domain-containing protein [Ruminococcaceae bacterium]|nr:S-layer homology domain-containing protein [Oscillospiraceae bacterium]